MTRSGIGMEWDTEWDIGDTYGVRWKSGTHTKRDTHGEGHTEWDTQSGIHTWWGSHGVGHTLSKTYTRSEIHTG